MENQKIDTISVAFKKNEVKVSVVEVKKKRKVYKKKKEIIKEKNIKVFFTNNEYNNVSLKDSIVVYKEYKLLKNLNPSTYFNNTNLLSDSLLIFIALSVSILFITVSKFISNIQFRALFGVLISRKKNIKIVYNKLPLSLKISCKVVYLINLSILITAIFIKYDYTEYTFTDFFIRVILVLFAYSFMLRGFNMVLQISVKNGKKIENINYLYTNYNSLIGLLLFPILLLYPFSSGIMVDVLLITGISVVLILQLLRMLFSFNLIFETKLSFVNMFIYFCAIEIAPLLIMF